MFFLVMICAKSSSNSDVLASSVVEATKVCDFPLVEATKVCDFPCSPRYGTYECFHDCLHDGFNDGNCINGRCCCTKR
ncbi:hypothetical protein N665_0354s0004 [Sinapis alba]|nr:hypothetical protein N665_0354s0004 [Sinapis alba]